MSDQQPGPSDLKVLPERKIPKMKDEGTRECLSDLDSDVSDEHYDERSWPSEESEYNSSESEDDSSETEDNIAAKSQSKASQQAQAKVSTWSSKPQPNIPNIPFTGTTGLKVQCSGRDPIDFFNLLATNEFYTLIVDETNANVARIPSGSRPPAWIDLKIKDLKTFLGILYHVGTIRIESLENYWNSSLFTPYFARYMTCERFSLIMRALHLSKDPEDDDGPLTTQVQKAKPLIDLFNKTMEQIHQPSRELFIGDSMLLRMDSLVFRASIKHKGYRSGMKLYMLQEPIGLVQKFAIYTREDDEDLADQSYSQIIHTLTQEYLDRGHSLFTDSLHNSVGLAQHLLSRKTYCTGGLRVNRKKNPLDVVKAKLKKGDVIERFNGENVCVLKWKDREEVLMISTEFNGEMVEVTNKKKVKRRPLAIEKYNEFIRKAGDQEEMTSYYPCEMVKMSWYKKLSIHVFHVMIVNAYYLFIKYSNKPRISFYDFRLEITKELVNYIDAREQ